MNHFAKGMFTTHRHKCGNQNRYKLYCGQCVSSPVCQENSTSLLGVGGREGDIYCNDSKKEWMPFCIWIPGGKPIFHFPTCYKILSLVKLQFQGHFDCLLLIDLSIDFIPLPESQFKQDSIPLFRNLGIEIPQKFPSDGSYVRTPNSNRNWQITLHKQETQCTHIHGSLAAEVICHQVMLMPWYPFIQQAVPPTCYYCGSRDSVLREIDLVFALMELDD